MAEGVVANISLGALVAAGILLLVAGSVTGWVAAHRRMRRKIAFTVQRVAELLNALPQAALLVDTESKIRAQNARAGQLLKEFGQNGLPMALDAAVVRMSRSRVAEMLEIPLPGSSARRLQVLVAPILDGDGVKEALVLFSDPVANPARADVYQRLTSTIAHELRTPLTAILGHVEILNSCRMDEEPLWRRSLGFVSSETERLARLVEDLLSLSRLDRAPLFLQPMNLRLAAEEAISGLYALAEQNHVALVLQAPASLPRIQADADRIRQVFLNLLENAIKYAPDSVVTVQLTVERDVILVEVGDTGPGIPPDDLAHIFEPLYRSERTAAGVRGTGLGLTIVQTILAQHNAPIRVHSTLGQGTSFSFSLPVDRSGEIPAD